MPEYFTLDELRALPQMSELATYTDDRCEAAAAYVVGVIERVVGTSFVARTVTAEIHDGGCYEIFLTRPWILSVTSATENGVTVTDPLRVKGQRLLRYSSASAYTPRSWRVGYDNVSVTYQSGYSASPPADLKEAALKATRAHLISTNSNAAIVDRQTSITTEMGTVSYVVAGTDRPFGYPEVDAVVNGYRDQLRGPLA